MFVIIDKNIGKDIKESIRKKFSVELIESFSVPSLNMPLSTHPDIQIHFLSENMAICSPESYKYYSYVIGKNKIKLISGTSVLGNTYPNDIAYNVARIGKYIFCNVKYTEPKILEYYNLSGYSIINTKQGYAKCSLCIASSNTVITEDIGLYNTLSSLTGLKALCVPKGNVLLNGYNYGFIGGASGLINDTLVFTGLINNDIKDFLNENAIKYFEAKNNKLHDFGSIICGGDIVDNNRNFRNKRE